MYLSLKNVLWDSSKRLMSTTIPHLLTVESDSNDIDVETIKKQITIMVLPHQTLISAIQPYYLPQSFILSMEEGFRVDIAGTIYVVVSEWRDTPVLSYQYQLHQLLVPMGSYLLLENEPVTIRENMLVDVGPTLNIILLPQTKIQPVGCAHIRFIIGDQCLAKLCCHTNVV